MILFSTLFTYICVGGLSVTAQGFPQLLGTWGGGLQNLMGGLRQYMGGAWGGGFKTVFLKSR